jgi:hypothetical protein
MGKKTDPVPKEFSSYEEAAEFWGTHDTTDYLQNSHPVIVVSDRWSVIGNQFSVNGKPASLRGGFLHS